MHVVRLPTSPQHSELTHGILQIMTPAEYGNFKAQLKAREEGDWKRVDWSLARRPLLHELEVVHGRMIAPNPKVRSRQRRTCKVIAYLHFHRQGYCLSCKEGQAAW